VFMTSLLAQATRLDDDDDGKGTRAT
jgi:hypothetical protein